MSNRHGLFLFILFLANLRGQSNEKEFKKSNFLYDPGNLLVQ
jgi:hypothetical protein